MAFAKMKHLLLPLTILCTMSLGLGADKGSAKEVDAKKSIFLSSNAHQKKVYEKLAGIKIKEFSIEGLDARKACEALYDQVAKRKGDYSNLVVIGSKKKVTLTLKNVNFAEVLNQICKQADLSWTVFFYDSNINYPMIGLGPKKLVSDYSKLAPNEAEK